MDESAQQAVSIGVNITIFIIALSISLTLMVALRNLAETATELDNSVPDGAILLSTQNVDDRIISGYELISYYYNYIVPYYHNTEDNEYEYNHPNVGVIIKTKDNEFKKEIISGDNTNIVSENAMMDLENFRNSVDLDANYVLNVKNHYDNTNAISGTTVIYIEQIPEMGKGDIFSYYISTVKNNFVNTENNELFDKCSLNIVYEDESYYVDVNNDSENGNEEVRKIIDGFDSASYSVRIKRNNLFVGMKSSSIIMYIEKVV